MQEFQIPTFNPELINKIQNEFSRIFERKASLKLSGIKKRNFYHWKEEGIIDWKSESDDEKRSWVRLNIYDFIWVKIVQAARDFGVPIEAIRKLKMNFLLISLRILKKILTTFTNTIVII